MIQQEKQDVKVSAAFTDGRYRVMFRRLLSSGSEKHTVFEVGKFMPFSITLYDGRNNESDKKGAISAWYYLVPEPATPARVYMFPPLVFLIVLGIGFMLRKNVKKKQ